VQKVLASSAALENNAAIKSQFVNERLRPWRDSVPEGSSREERAQLLISHLYERYNTRQENALVLFLQVLSSSLHYNDALRGDLEELAIELAEAVKRNR
jgi:hypothetical protein